MEQPMSHGKKACDFFCIEFRQKNAKINGIVAVPGEDISENDRLYHNPMLVHMAIVLSFSFQGSGHQNNQ